MTVDKVPMFTASIILGFHAVAAGRMHQMLLLPDMVSYNRCIDMRRGWRTSWNVWLHVGTRSDAATAELQSASQL